MTTITAYRTPPQQERKAAQEARDAGYRAYVPTEKVKHRTALGKTISRRRPVAPGYVFANGKPAEAEHIRARIGNASRVEVARLYPRRMRQTVADAFAPGDTVIVDRGPFAALTGTVVGKNGRRGYVVDVQMFGRTLRTPVASDCMRKHDPG
jgi:transcription antitermination factor NusG